MKDKLILQVRKLQEAVENEDIHELIEAIRELQIDTRYNSPICNFMQQLLITNIRNYMLREKKEVLRVTRIAEYHIVTTDCYTIKDGVLHRNGCDCKYSAIGKLYAAYKQINNNE